MISRAKRFLQTRSAVPADFEQTIGELGSMRFPYPFKPFADRLGDRFGHALSGKPGQLLGKLVSIFVFDVQAQIGRQPTSKSTILPQIV